jgi:phosphatidylglycerophosphate synthase
MRGGGSLAGLDMELVPFESAEAKTNDELRKRERPFAGQLTKQSVRKLERECYYSAYKGVTDVLTKYLWPEWALALTRVASRIGISPNLVTAIGAAFCLAATWLFFVGSYWSGLAVGFVFMVLDTVDGKLARCTLTSSKFGEFFDHGIDLVHPPFWYWAWGVGLIHYGLPLSSETFMLVMLAIVVGYVLQRVVEGIFIAMFGMHIHVWRRFDSRFRLITARRNPNMIILFVALALQRPDIGLIGVAVWTGLSLVVHLIQLIQAVICSMRGKAISSWLS